ncbi:hypothetical protein BC834DRAFT_243343 [Gloeopeniophorella convolvens]|nr:hypothetical protein BC834DRAFT_243343 [Gloeopeniophorella convolvens]
MRLQLNIKHFVYSTLLSTATPSYKLGTSRIVMDSLQESIVQGLPEGWHDDAAKYAVVSVQVTSDLTNARSAMKKLLRTSVTKSSKSNNNKENDPDDSTEDDSQLEEQDESRDEDQPDGTRTDKEYPGSTASIQHWGRFAIMRAVFLKDPGSNYWDDVDAELRRIRADANKAHPTDRGKADIEVHRCVTSTIHT